MLHREINLLHTIENYGYEMMIFLCGFLFLACNSSETTGEAEHGDHTEMHDDHMNSTHEADKTGPEYTSKYICPMHCKGSGSDQPGECPVCGMDYKLNEEG